MLSLSKGNGKKFYKFLNIFQKPTKNKKNPKYFYRIKIKCFDIPMLHAEKFQEK